jgi:Beta propeller domain
MVPGYRLDQFSLSEHEGYLRVATTSAPIWWGGALPASSQSYVTVLADRAGALVPVGQVAGLGAGQKIYSVRFIEGVAYVVTFRSIDPLYTIDLTSPSAPRVAGSLELAGYSAYLHPVGAGLLLGIGQAVGPGDEPSGTQLELFDVSDPSAPRLLARSLLGEDSSTAVQYEHHAFLFWAPTALAVIPVSIYPPAPGPLPASPAGAVQLPLAPAAQGFTGAIGFHVDRSGITEAGRIAHDPVNELSPPVDRSLVIGERLFTISSEGVMASDLATFARLAFAAFPTPSPGSVGSGTATPPRG